MIDLAEEIVYFLSSDLENKIDRRSYETHHRLLQSIPFWGIQNNVEKNDNEQKIGRV